MYFPQIFSLNLYEILPVFRTLFGSEERKRLTLELYNAINQTDYDNPDDLQLNTIEDVVYMGMKNDVSFLLASDLNMYEQQSTWNPNMPLRCFLYAAHALEKYLRDTRNSSRLLTSTLVKVPTPRLVVLYNGIQENDDTVLSLSDCFENPGGDIDVIVHVYNINPGHQLPDCCRPLEDYSRFVSAYRDRITSVGAEQAANEALDSLPEGEVKNYILSQKGEVIDMLLTEYDEEETLKVVAEDSRAEGQRKGEAIGMAKGEAIGVVKGRALGEDRLASLVSAMVQSGADQEAILKASSFSSSCCLSAIAAENLTGSVGQTPFFQSSCFHPKNPSGS
ncbi:hypothetical protein ACTQ4Q_05070 [Bacillota bacterium LCP21S3_D9]